MQQPNHTTTPTTTPISNTIQHQHQFPTQFNTNTNFQHNSTPPIFNNTNTNFQQQKHQFSTPTTKPIFNTNTQQHSTTPTLNNTNNNNTNTQHLRLHTPSSSPTLENLFLIFQFWRFDRVGRNTFLPIVKLQISAQIYFTRLLRLLGIHNCRFY